MKIEGFIWLADIVDKIESKHGVTVSEVESLFTSKPSRIKGENVYRALGQAGSGRYLAAFFIYKMTREALVISARAMTDREKKYYAKRKK